MASLSPLIQLFLKTYSRLFGYIINQAFVFFLPFLLKSLRVGFLSFVPKEF